MKLEDRTAIVTGASRGIGRAIARRFAAEGARVAINFRHGQDAAEAVAREIHDGGGDAILIQADVGAPAEARRLIGEAIDAWGRVDVLVSNAGVIFDRPYVDSGEDIWHAAIETNLHGFHNVAQAVLPHMIERGHGRILATGSCIAEAGDFGDNHYAVCSASKGGIIAMLRAIAAEVATHGITVNAVSPGYIATGMLDEIDAEGSAGVLARVPMRRYGRPEEIAAAMAFLASDEAAYITGQTLRVNGGLTMT